MMDLIDYHLRLRLSTLGFQSQILFAEYSVEIKSSVQCQSANFILVLKDA